MLVIKPPRKGECKVLYVKKLCRKVILKGIILKNVRSLLTAEDYLVVQER